MQMSFDVSFTSFDLLKQGVTEAVFHRVIVEADTYFDGQCLAVQMASTVQAMRRSPLDYATSAIPVI